MIAMMKASCHDPPILAKRAPAKPNVVACAIAMSRGEKFGSDAKALELFGVAPDTKVRVLWVEGKLAELYPAGMGKPGEPALPAYLLDRGKPTTEQQIAAESSDEGCSSAAEEDDEQRRQEQQHESRVDRWSCDVAAQDARWHYEQDEAKAQRAKEAAEWDASHGELHHAALTAEQPDFYWALAHEIGRRPKWHLRKGTCLQDDVTRIMADDEPLLLYRDFPPKAHARPCIGIADAICGASQACACAHDVHLCANDMCS